MSAPPLEILEPLRTAIVNASDIVGQLGIFLDGPSVHTRRPIPPGAKYPAVTIGPIVTRVNLDGINDFRPQVAIDVCVYGEQDKQFREVELAAELIHSLFHSQRRSITVTNYSVTQILAGGPMPAPVDDASRIGRRVPLVISLYAR
ncbi:hypothetical protein [Mesorhizobium sp. M0058]|uniref:hypothetical protein n=1 Tax=Mesorhizobium sp. M0058 TaxID=2956865 RepID=UPI0033372EB1